jgi:hypothetical protein
MDLEMTLSETEQQLRARIVEMIVAVPPVEAEVEGVTDVLFSVLEDYLLQMATQKERVQIVTQLVIDLGRLIHRVLQEERKPNG